MLFSKTELFVFDDGFLIDEIIQLGENNSFKNFPQRTQQTDGTIAGRTSAVFTLL